MPAILVRIRSLTLLAVALVSGLSLSASKQDPSNDVSLTIRFLPEEVIQVRYSLRQAVTALHYEQELGGYRDESWTPSDSAFRWVDEEDGGGDGERLERSDGQRFDTVEVSIPIDYRSLPKSYGPFSPFSQGGTLLHSGQFHVCVIGPCEDPMPLAITISAEGLTVGVYGQRTGNQASFISRDSGTNVFVGTLLPVDADGFIAIIDPGLPYITRTHLKRSLPQAIEYFKNIYGKLSFKPELYVSIDSRPERRGRKASQGGTLPHQIFIHFDGENAERRVSEQPPFSLDWFFAHEAAHLYQQDDAGQQAFDNNTAWIHEGGADAMGAVAIARRGEEQQAYVFERLHAARAACQTGLRETSLSRASADGKFGLHYQCGLLLWLALDEVLYDLSGDSLHDLNKLLFEHVSGGQEWSLDLFLNVAADLGAGSELLGTIQALSHGNYDDPSVHLQSVASLAEQSIQRHSSALD